jgi:hypothetical protein
LIVSSRIFFIMDSTLSSRPMSKTGVTKINTTVQFPRGGRQIGTETGLSRSTSIERGTTAILYINRHLFISNYLHFRSSFKKKALF